jgi:hypothetical protein
MIGRDGSVLNISSGSVIKFQVQKSNNKKQRSGDVMLLGKVDRIETLEEHGMYPISGQLRIKVDLMDPIHIATQRVLKLAERHEEAQFLKKHREHLPQSLDTSFSRKSRDGGYVLEPLPSCLPIDDCQEWWLCVQLMGKGKGAVQEMIEVCKHKVPYLELSKLQVTATVYSCGDERKELQRVTKNVYALHTGAAEFWLNVREDLKIRKVGEYTVGVTASCGTSDSDLVRIFEGLAHDDWNLTISPGVWPACSEFFPVQRILHVSGRQPRESNF